VQGSPLFVSSWWLAFTAFVGANLLQFGFTNCLPAGHHPAQAGRARRRVRLHPTSAALRKASQ
jgi:hypothetical protein